MCLVLLSLSFFLPLCLFALFYFYYFKWSVFSREIGKTWSWMGGDVRRTIKESGRENHIQSISMKTLFLYKRKVHIYASVENEKVNKETLDNIRNFSPVSLDYLSLVIAQCFI